MKVTYTMTAASRMRVQFAGPQPRACQTTKCEQLFWKIAATTSATASIQQVLTFLLKMLQFFVAILANWMSPREALFLTIRRTFQFGVAFV